MKLATLFLKSLLLMSPVLGSSPGGVRVDGTYNLHLYFGEKTPFLDELTLAVDRNGKLRGQMHVPNDFDAELEGIVKEDYMGVVRLAFAISLPEKYYESFGRKLFYELRFLSHSRRIYCRTFGNQNVYSLGLSVDHAAKQIAIYSVSVDVCNGITRGEAEKILAAKIFIGLHLNLTEGRPIGNDAAISDLLTPEGCFKSASIGLASNVELDSLLMEFWHQLERFQFLFGQSPTHIDSHQHFTYLHPSAFEAILKLSKAEDIPIRCPQPFIHEESLRNFCDRVKFRYGIWLPFVPEERAHVLNKLFNQYSPMLRSQQLYLDFDPSILERHHQETLCAEMVLHPQLDTKGRNGF